MEGHDRQQKPENPISVGSVVMYVTSWADGQIHFVRATSILPHVLADLSMMGGAQARVDA
jgi:hypothetical protein